MSPIRHKLTQYKALTEPVAIEHLDWLNPLSEPMRPKVNILAAIVIAAAPVFTPAPPPAAPSMDSWYAPLDEPVRVEPRAQQFNQRISVVEEVPGPGAQGIEWYVPLDEPVRPPARLTQPENITQPLFVVVPPSVPDFGWYTSLDEPIRTRPFALLEGGEVHLLKGLPGPGPAGIEWYVPLSEPLRRITAPTYSVEAGPVFFEAPAVVPPLDWYLRLSEPLRDPKVLVVEQAQVIEVPAVVSVSFGWYRSLPEPVRKQVVAQSALGVDVLLGDATVPSFDWFQSLALPLPLAVNPVEGGEVGAYLIGYPGPGAEAIEWFIKLSEPVWVGPHKMSWIVAGNIMLPQTIISGVVDRCLLNRTDFDRDPIEVPWCP